MSEQRCEVWSDHVWSASRIIEAGRHPVNGRCFVRTRRSCERCNRTVSETTWPQADEGRAALLLSDQAQA